MYSILYERDQADTTIAIECMYWNWNRKGEHTFLFVFKKYVSYLVYL